VLALEAGDGAAELDVRKGDEGNAERHVAMDRCTRISIIQASVLEACNRPFTETHHLGMIAVERPFARGKREHRRAGRRSKGASATCFCKNSGCEISKCVVPSRQGVFSFSTTCPAALICTRSLSRAGRVM
jgi:hypothetical protein